MAQSLKRTILYTVLAAMIATAAILVLPSRIIPADPEYLFAPRRAEWEGVLSLWHVNGWRTAVGSRTGQLQRVASVYEKKNPGLLIEIENVDVDQMAARLAAGLRPDLLTWPGGLADPGVLPLASISLSESLSEPLAASVPYDSEGALALPWVWGGEVVIINTAMAERQKAALPTGDTWTADEFISLAQALVHRTGRSRSIQVYGLAAAGESLLSFGLPGQMTLPEGVRDPGAETLWQAWESFAAGRAGILLGSQWEVAAMGRLRDRGKGFEIMVMPVPTDLYAAVQVQWISAVHSGEESRTRMATGYVQMLLSAQNQKIISEKTGCLSAVPGCSADGDVIELLSMRSAGAVIFPSPLETLTHSILIQAASGDTASRQYIRSRCFYIDPACINPYDVVE